MYTRHTPYMLLWNKKRWRECKVLSKSAGKNLTVESLNGFRDFFETRVLVLTNYKNSCLERILGDILVYLFWLIKH